MAKQPTKIETLLSGDDASLRSQRAQTTANKLKIGAEKCVNQAKAVVQELESKLQDHLDIARTDGTSLMATSQSLNAYEWFTKLVELETSLELAKEHEQKVNNAFVKYFTV